MDEPYIIDLVILGVLALGLWRGFTTGAVRQVLGVLSAVVGFLLAVRLMDPAGAMLADSLNLSSAITPLLGFALVFLAVQVVVMAAIRLVEFLLGATKLTILNQIAGAALGGLKALLLLSALLVALRSFEYPPPENREASTFYAPVAVLLPQTWEAVRAVYPEARSLADRFGTAVEERLPEDVPRPPNE